MLQFGRLIVCICVAFLLAVPAAAQTNSTAPAPSTQKRGETHIYLFRGLFGVFSLGMDDLAAKLNKAGFGNTKIHAWDEWPNVADAIADRHARSPRSPVVIIGHSLGANSTIQTAESLSPRKVPVLLGVIFDATDPHFVSPNVYTFFNFYAQDGFGHRVEPAPGFKGELDNFDLSSDGTITHTNIDALDKFHEFIIARLNAMTTE